MMRYNLTLNLEGLPEKKRLRIVLGSDNDLKGTCCEFKDEDAQNILNLITGIWGLDQFLEQYGGSIPKEPEQKKTFNAVTGPDHYLHGRNYEPRKVIDDWGLGFYLGNTVKYISRAGRKGSRLEDLQKARQYLDWEIEKEEMKS